MSNSNKSEPVLLRTVIAEKPLSAARAVPGEPLLGEPVRISPTRYFAAGVAVMTLSAALWPFLPRVYEATATIVLSPTNMEGQSDVLEAARQPLDESFILSDLDRFHSVALATEVINAHELAQDDEFRPQPNRLDAVQTHIAGFFGDVLPQTWASERTARLSDVLEATSAAVSASHEEPLIRQNLWSKMVLDRDRQSYTVKVGFRSTVPEKAAALTTTLVDAYLRSQVLRKVEHANSMNKLLSDRVKEAERRADKSRSELEDFLEQSGLIDEGAQISLEAQLSTLSTELANARANLIDVRTRADSLVAMRAAGHLDSAPEVLASPVIQQLNQSLTQSMSRLAVMSAESKTISRQAEIERERIVRSVGVEVENWRKRERLLSDEITKIRQTMVQRRREDLRLEALRLQANNDNQVLSDAMTRMKMAGPSTEALKPDADILSPATVPSKPIFPSLPLYLVGAFGVASLVGTSLNASGIFSSVRRLMKS